MRESGKRKTTKDNQELSVALFQVPWRGWGNRWVCEMSGTSGRMPGIEEGGGYVIRLEWQECQR